MNVADLYNVCRALCLNFIGVWSSLLCMIVPNPDQLSWGLYNLSPLLRPPAGDAYLTCENDVSFIALSFMHWHSVNWHCVASSSISFANTVIDFVPCWVLISLKTAIDRFTCFAQCAFIFVTAMSSVSLSVRPASLINLKSFPPQRIVSLSFCVLSLMPIESSSRLVCSYHSSNFQRYF